MYSPKSTLVRAVICQLWIASGLVFVLSLGAFVGLVHAAPDLQTATPTPTETLPALPSPPVDGGVVAVQNLTVYGGPGDQFAELGGLPYGAFIYPQARSQDSIWVQIEYAGFEGWVFRPLVDMGFDVVTLPVPPQFVTPRPDGGSVTLTQDTGTPTGTPEAPVQTTPSPLPTAIPEPQDIQSPPTALPVAESPSPVPTVPPAPAPVGVAPDVSLGRVALVAAAVLGLVLSVGYLLSGRGRGRMRKGEFVVAHCPACGEGRLTVEGTRRARVVRCDNCRSVLRQLRSGMWRYAVDPLPDRDFGERYNGGVFSEEEFVDLAVKRARQRVTGEKR